MSMAVGISTALLVGETTLLNWRSERRLRPALRQALTNFGVDVEWEQALGGLSHRLRSTVGGTGRMKLALSRTKKGHRMKLSGLTAVRPLGLSRQDELRNVRSPVDRRRHGDATPPSTRRSS